MKQLLGVLLLVGVILTYWKWIAAVFIILMVIRMVWRWWVRRQTFEEAWNRHVAGLAARADQQHQWFIAGDPRGVHGAFPPAV